MALPHLFRDIVFRHSTNAPAHDVASFQAFLVSRPDVCRWIVNLSLLPERLASVQAGLRWPPSFEVSAKLLALLPNLHSLVLVHCSLVLLTDPVDISLRIPSLTLIGDADSLVLWRSLRCFTSVGRLCAHVRQGTELTLAPPHDGLTTHLQIHTLVLLDIDLCNEFLAGLFHGSLSPSLRSLSIDMDLHFLQRAADAIHRILRLLSNNLEELRYRVTPTGYNFGTCHVIKTNPTLANIYTEHMFEGLSWDQLTTLTFDFHIVKSHNETRKQLLRVSTFLHHFTASPTLRCVSLTIRTNAATIKPDESDLRFNLWPSGLLGIERKLLAIPRLERVYVQKNGHPLSGPERKLLASMWWSLHDGGQLCFPDVYRFSP